MEKIWESDFGIYVDIGILLLQDNIFDYSSKENIFNIIKF